MPIPLAFLNNAELVDILRTALERAESIGDILRNSVWRMASLIFEPNGKKADTKRVSSFIDNLAPERLYWSRLEIPFRHFVVRLAENPNEQEKVLACWVCEELFRQARNAFDQTTRSLDNSARLLRAVTGARQQLFGELAAIVNPFKEILNEQN